MRVCATRMACILCFATASAASAAVIDSFTSTQFGNPLTLSRSTVGTSTVNEGLVFNAIGNERTTRLVGTAFTDAGIDRVDMGIFPNSGLLDYASSAGANGRLTLTYPNLPGDLNADFSGDQLLRIDVTQYDFAAGAPMRVLVTLEDGTDQPAESKLLTSPGAQSVDFLLSDFPSTLDLTDIQSIVVEFRPGQSTDFRLNSISTIVPEPASATTLLVGAVAVFSIRRQRD